MAIRQKVNGNKAKGAQVLFGKKCRILKMDSCGVSGERAGCNSIKCAKCQGWVHRCSDVPRHLSLLSCRNVLACRTCLGYNCTVEVKV